MMLRALLTGLFLLASTAAAQDSRISIWAEDDAVYVFHRHLTTEAGIDYSEVQIIDKRNGAEIARMQISPLTRLVSVGQGLFAGQSWVNPAESRQEYNYVLLSSQGHIVSQALVMPGSGHCSNLGAYQAQGDWYDERAPLELIVVKGKVLGVATSGNTWQSKCFFPIR